MQHARFKPHAYERTCNPVQRPDFRGCAMSATNAYPDSFTPPGTHTHITHLPVARLVLPSLHPGSCCFHSFASFLVPAAGLVLSRLPLCFFLARLLPGWCYRYLVSSSRAAAGLVLSFWSRLPGCGRASAAALAAAF